MPRKTAQDLVAKAAADPTLQAWRAAQAAVAPKETASARLAEAAQKAKEAAEKLPGQSELSAFAVQSQALAGKYAAELAAAKQYATQLETAAKPAQDRFSTANAELAKAQANVNSLAQQIPGKQAAAKSSQDQINQLHQAAKAVEAELQQMQTQIDRLQKAVAAAKEKPASVTQK